MAPIVFSRPCLDATASSLFRAWVVVTRILCWFLAGVYVTFVVYNDMCMESYVAMMMLLPLT